MRLSVGKAAITMTAAATVAATVAGCGSTAHGSTAQSGRSSASSVSTIRVGLQTIPEDYVWQAKNWGAPFHLKYTNSVSPSASREFQQLLSGQVDVVDTGSGPALSAIAKDPKLEIVALRHSGGARDELMVPAGSSATSLSQLKGKKIAVPAGSGAGIAFEQYLASKKLSSSDFTFVNMEPSAEIQALKQGLIAAGVAWEPTPSFAVTAGSAKVIANFASVTTDPAFIVTTSTFANAHSQALIRFLAATTAMDSYIQKNPGQAATLAANVASQSGANASPAAFKRAFQLIDTSPDITQRNLSDLQPVEQFMIKEGRLSGAVNLKKAVVTRYLTAAQKLVQS